MHGDADRTPRQDSVAHAHTNSSISYSANLGEKQQVPAYNLLLGLNQCCERMRHAPVA